MDIHDIRAELKIRPIYEIPLKVTFYARVSSESDGQLNSLGNQISYYENLIKSNKKWEFVNGYIDEGISAISTKHRDNFHRMIDDAQKGKFDLIITKEITRFARNTLDSIQYTRQLFSYGVGVFFQNDNIITLDEDSELRLTIMSGIAQDELRKLSSRVKFGHQQAIKKGVVLGNSRILGYEKVDKRLAIVEEQAEMIRELFNLYSTDQYSMRQIEKIFWEKDYRNYDGNKISRSTLTKLIANPKYKGYYVGNKVRIVDMFTKKQKYLPQEEWVMFKDETGEIVPAIVSEEIWDKANLILQKRSEDVKTRQGICNHDNLLTGKLYCAHCGRAYYRKETTDKKGNVNSKWICSGKINNGADSCPSFAIFESEIKPILLEVLNQSKVTSKTIIDEYIELYSTLKQGKETERLIKQQEKIIEVAEKKRAKLLEYNATDKISDEEFIKLNNQCKLEIESANKEIFELTSTLSSEQEFKQHMAKIKEVLITAEKDAAQGIVNREFVNCYIDKIIVTPEDGKLRLDINIFTGKTTSVYLEHLKGRMGYTFLKMCPIRTMTFVRNDRTVNQYKTSVTYDYSINM